MRSTAVSAPSTPMNTNDTNTNTHTSSPSRCSSLSSFETLQTIGSGGFGKIVRVRRISDDREFVWKQLNYGEMNKKDRTQVVSEVNILRNLRRHPHIVRYCDRIVDKDNATLYIIMEHCEGGDLASLIRHYKKAGLCIAEDFIWKILGQITSALKQCHGSKNGTVIIHRDLKPANILLDRDLNAKLCDFGLADVTSSGKSKPTGMSMGTPFYMAPERVNDSKYDERSDIWSLGCIMYELCTLSPPFEAPDHDSLKAKINTGVIPPM